MTQRLSSTHAMYTSNHMRTRGGTTKGGRERKEGRRKKEGDMKEGRREGDRVEESKGIKNKEQ